MMPPASTLTIVVALPAAFEGPLPTFSAAAPPLLLEVAMRGATGASSPVPTVPSRSRHLTCPGGLLGSLEYSKKQATRGGGVRVLGASSRISPSVELLVY